jgi:hypothetical protein
MSVSLVVSVAVLIATWLAAESRAQAPDKSAITGAWTLNRDLSDRPADGGAGAAGGSGDDRSGDAGRRGRGGGGRGGGGFRGGYGGGGGGRPPQTPTNQDEIARMRDAIRDVTNPPDHLTIVQTDSMVILTGPDGRTTRMSPDGQKVKDENTKIERKTRWDGAKLVSEVNGAGPSKITQTYEVDADHHLKISILMDGNRGNQPRTVARIYDSDALTK